MKYRYLNTITECLNQVLKYNQFLLVFLCNRFSRFVLLNYAAKLGPFVAISFLTLVKWYSQNWFWSNSQSLVPGLSVFIQAFISVFHYGDTTLYSTERALFQYDNSCWLAVATYASGKGHAYPVFHGRHIVIMSFKRLFSLYSECSPLKWNDRFGVNSLQFKLPAHLQTCSASNENLKLVNKPAIFWLLLILVASIQSICQCLTKKIFRCGGYSL